MRACDTAATPNVTACTYAPARADIPASANDSARSNTRADGYNCAADCAHRRFYHFADHCCFADSGSNCTCSEFHRQRADINACESGERWICQPIRLGVE